MRTATSVRANGFGIKTSLLVEKCQGYPYEHAVSYTWNAMKGYHYLMRLVHLLNALALATPPILAATEVVETGLGRGPLRCRSRAVEKKWLQCLGYSS